MSSQQPPRRSQPSQSSHPIESNAIDRTSEIILAAPRGKRSASPKGSPNVDATRRPAVGQLSLPGSKAKTIVKIDDDDDDDDDLEGNEPTATCNVARVKNF